MTVANFSGLLNEMILVILNYLIKENVIYIDRSIRGAAVNKMNRLRLVNKNWKLMVEDWLKVYACKYLRSPHYDYFDPQTTKFVLEAARGYQRFSPSHVMFDFHYADLIHLGNTPIHITSLQHLSLEVTDEAHLGSMLRFCPKFENLQTLEITISAPDYDNLFNPDGLLGFWVWELFWERSKWCHPGKCCSCCQIPDLRVHEKYFDDKLPMTIPEPPKSGYTDVQLRYWSEMWFNPYYNLYE